MCFSWHIHHKVNFPDGHYLNALRMVNKHYVQKHVSYYYHAHYFYILNTFSYYRCGHALPFISLFLLRRSAK